MEEIILLPYAAGLSAAAETLLWESLRESLLVPPFNRAFLKSPSWHGLSSIAELLVEISCLQKRLHTQITFKLADFKPF